MVARRIAMVIAHEGFRDEEYWQTKDVLSKAGESITTLSSATSPAQSKFGKSAPVDALLGDASPEDFHAVVFVGGPGTQEYFDDPRAHAFARALHEAGKPVTAICIAPVILARAGLLRGRRATVFESGREELTARGAEVTREPVVIDGLVITGNGPDAAEAFGRAVAGALG